MDNFWKWLCEQQFYSRKDFKKIIVGFYKNLTVNPDFKCFDHRKSVHKSIIRQIVSLVANDTLIN